MMRPLHVIILICFEAVLTLSDLSILSKCNADIVIAGLFPIKIGTKVTKSMECVGPLSPSGIQETLAMIYAVKRINEDQSLLSNCTIGVDIGNTCNMNEFSIKSCLQFDFFASDIAKHSDELYHPRKKSKTEALIGARKSQISHTVATMTNLFQMPTISYGSTDHTLSNRERYPTFARTIPNDILLAKAVSWLIRALNWNIVFTISDQTDFSRSGFAMFQELLKRKPTAKKKRISKVCIAYHFDLQDIFDNYEKFEETVKKYPESSAFVLFLHDLNANELLQKVFYHDNLKLYTWIFLDLELTYSIKKMFSTSSTGNAIMAIQPASFNFHQNSSVLKDYWQFVQDYYSNEKLHELVPGMKECVQKNCLRSPGLKEFFSPLLPYVIDAIYVVAHALNDSKNCENVSGDRTTGRSLMETILKVKFKSSLGYDFEFDRYGDVKGQIDILLLKESRLPRLELAGNWNSKQESMSWLSPSLKSLSVSSCDSKCKPGFGKIAISHHADCCSKCIECGDKEYKNYIEDKCRKCPKYFVPNQNKSACRELAVDVTEFSQPIGIAMTSFAAAGQILVTFIMVVFINYRHTHLVRASNWEISITMLIGAFLCFSSPYVILNRISDFSCRLTVIGSGLSLSLMIGSLLVKTNRIYRLFSKDVLRKGSPKFLSRRWQFAIVLVITLCDLTLSAVVAFYPSDPVGYKRVLSVSHDITYAMCHYNKKLVGIWWLYHCSLVFICTYQAILSRNVPGNYNEARKIMLAMLAITLEMCFVVPSFYYGAIGFSQQLFLALINLVSAGSTVLCIYMPKIYIIFFRPAKNKEWLPHGTLGSFSKTENLYQDKQQTTIFQNYVAAEDKVHRSTTARKATHCNDRLENGERTVKRRKVKQVDIFKLDHNLEGKTIH